MNLYKMCITGQFWRIDYFDVEAENKEDAVVVAKNEARLNPKYAGPGTFWNIDSIRCIKKLQRRKT